MKPLISVVIPAYNSAKTIGATLQSVVSQTFQDFEIIVVDDGSVDDTVSQIKKFSDRAHYFVRENGGPAAARNFGVSKASGEWIAFVDADDLWFKQKLELQWKALQREPQLDAVHCSAYFVDAFLKVIETRSCDPSHDSFLDILLRRNLPAFSSSVMVRKSYFEKLGGFATDIPMETWYMACQLAKNNRLRSLSDFLVLYRWHGANRSRGVKGHIESGIRSLNKLFSDSVPDAAIQRELPRIRAHFFAMLSGICLNNREWKEAFCWALRALKTSPMVGGYLAGLPIRKLRRLKILRQKISFADLFPYAV